MNTDKTNKNNIYSYSNTCIPNYYLTINNNITIKRKTPTLN